jgi:hypothetical protein
MKRTWKRVLLGPLGSRNHGSGIEVLELCKWARKLSKVLLACFQVTEAKRQDCFKKSDGGSLMNTSVSRKLAGGAR